MFDITRRDDGTVALAGRFDASTVDEARTALADVDGPTVIDFAELDYISSAGLGVLFSVQKRLMASGHGLTLVNLNPHILEVFTIAGFDSIFDIRR